MTQQLINVGLEPDQGGGDALRDAMIKINDNFTEIYAVTTGNEKVTVKTGAQDTVNHEVNVSKIFYHTGIISNFTVNLTGLAMEVNEVVNVILILNQGSVRFIPNALSIASVSQTINWRGSAQPLGNVNKKDVVSFSILRPSSVSYVVLATLTTFGTV